MVRTNLAASDAAYSCVFETEDDAGVRGVKLSKELMAVAGGEEGDVGALAQQALYSVHVYHHMMMHAAAFMCITA